MEEGGFIRVEFFEEIELGTLRSEMGKREAGR